LPSGDRAEEEVVVPGLQAARTASVVAASASTIICFFMPVDGRDLGPGFAPPFVPSGHRRMRTVPAGQMTRNSGSGWLRKS
jgi:hypothetical protein